MDPGLRIIQVHYRRLLCSREKLHGFRIVSEHNFRQPRITKSVSGAVRTALQQNRQARDLETVRKLAGDPFQKHLRIDDAREILRELHQDLLGSIDLVEEVFVDPPAQPVKSGTQLHQENRTSY